MHFAILQRRLVANARARVRSGELTERSLGRLAGLSQPHIHHVLNGTRLLSTEAADRMLRNLSISLVDLLEADDLLPIAGSNPTRPVPLLKGSLGIGHAFPVAQRSVIPWPAVDRLPAALQEPALVRLAADPAMFPLFAAGDMALLERAEDARLSPGAPSFYAIEHNGAGMVRRLRRSRERLYPYTLARPNPATWDYISLSDRHILEVVKAKVVWIGRNLEPLDLETTRSFEEAG